MGEHGRTTARGGTNVLWGDITALIFFPCIAIAKEKLVTQSLPGWFGVVFTIDSRQVYQHHASLFESLVQVQRFVLLPHILSEFMQFGVDVSVPASLAQWIALYMFLEAFTNDFGQRREWVVLHIILVFSLLKGMVSASTSSIYGDTGCLPTIFVGVTAAGVTGVSR